MTTNENPTPPETTPPDTEGDFEASSAEFAKALQEFERRQSGAESVPMAETQPAVGERLSARVVSVGESHVLLDYGGRSEGVAETPQFRNEDGSMGIIPGDQLELYVVESGEQVVLAKAATPSKAGGARAERVAALAALRETIDAGVPVTGKVTGTNSGGLVVDVGGVRAFCPVSQIENGFCADPGVYVGQTLEFLVASVEEGRGSAVLSRRKLLRRSEEASGRQLLSELKPGDEREAVVRRLEPFGAFVGLGGVDGLVHVSEIRHERTNHPKEALKVGERVKVKVLKIETGKDGKPRIALSIKAVSPDPWEGVTERFKPGERVSGTVVRLTDFGAFIALAPGIDGLVHVSEVASHRIATVKDALKRHQAVEAIVLSVDADKRRIALSVRQALEASLPPARTPQIGETVEGRVGNVVAFGVFVDLPEFGPRASGLLPRELSGHAGEAEMKEQFKIGQPVRVEVIELREGKIRLGLEGGPRPEPRAPRAPRAEREGGGRSGRGERGGLERSDRPRREGPGRGAREERPNIVSSTVPANEPTTMALALRKAMEDARRKAEGQGR